MTQIILDNGGTVDKYIGDAIMAFYGAPLEVKNHEYKAVLSVFQMNLKLEELRNKWESEGEKWPDLVKNMQHRIGINTVISDLRLPANTEIRALFFPIT